MLIEITILALVVLLLIGLFISFHIRIRVDISNVRSDISLTFKWLIFEYTIDPAGKITYDEASDEPAGQEEKQDADINRMMYVGKKLLRPGLQLTKGILGAVHINKFKCKLTFGFDDPAYTGVLCGYLYAVQGYLNTCHEMTELYIEPVFTEKKMDIFVLAEMRFRIYSLLPAIASFLFNRDVRQVLWMLIRNKDIPGAVP